MSHTPKYKYEILLAIPEDATPSRATRLARVRSLGIIGPRIDRPNGFQRVSRLHHVAGGLADQHRRGTHRGFGEGFDAILVGIARGVDHTGFCDQPPFHKGQPGGI